MLSGFLILMNFWRSSSRPRSEKNGRACIMLGDSEYKVSQLQGFCSNLSWENLLEIKVSQFQDFTKVIQA